MNNSIHFEEKRLHESQQQQRIQHIFVQIIFYKHIKKILK